MPAAKTNNVGFILIFLRVCKFTENREHNKNDIIFVPETHEHCSTYNDSQVKRRRLYWILTAAALVPLGLLSREFSSVPVETGDALWAMMVFSCLRIVRLRTPLNRIALYSMLISVADELSQLVSWSWLDRLRSTTIGHLILGQGFLWADIAAYAIGIALIWLVAGWLEHNCVKLR